MFLSAYCFTLSTASGLSAALGQSTRIEQATSKVNFYLIVLTCTFLALAVVGLIARKIFHGPIESDDQEAVLNLSDLRRMHRDGELTDDEYLAARSAALAESGVYVDNDPPNGPGSDSAVTQTGGSVAKADPATGAGPGGGPGVELGPELLDKPDTPPKDEDKPDNPG